MFYKFHLFLLFLSANKYGRDDWSGALKTLKEKSTSISYLNKKHPGNEITVVCHFSPQGKVYSSPHLNQVLCASEFDLILQVLLQLVSDEGNKKIHLMLFLPPQPLFVLALYQKINFSWFWKRRKPLQKRQNQFFSWYMWLFSISPEGWCLKWIMGSWGWEEKLKGFSCLPFSQLIQ